MWLGFLRWLNLACFLALLGIFIGHDTNGRFLGIGEQPTLVLSALLIAIGFTADCLVFRRITKDRPIAVFMALFYGYVAYDLCRNLTRS